MERIYRGEGRGRELSVGEGLEWGGRGGGVGVRVGLEQVGGREVLRWVYEGYNERGGRGSES